MRRWFPTFRNDHAGPLNAHVHRKLVGMYPADDLAEAIIEMFRSTEAIDRHTRLALADAFEAELHGNRSAFRFRLVKPAHRTTAKTEVFEQMLEMQEIAALYRLYREQGLTWDEASFLLNELGCGKTKLAEALDYDANRIVHVSRGPEKSAASSE